MNNDNEERADESEINLYALVRFLLRKWYVIILFGLIGTGAGWVHSELIQKPQYKSVASVLFINKTGTASNSTINNYLEVIKSRKVIEPAIKNSEIVGISYENARANLEVVMPKETQFMNIAITTDNANNSQLLLEHIIKSFETEIKVINADVYELSIVDAPNSPHEPSNIDANKQMMIAGGGTAILGVVVLFFAYDAREAKKRRKLREQEMAARKIAAEKREEEFEEKPISMNGSLNEESSRRRGAAAVQTLNNINSSRMRNVRVKAPGSAYRQSGKATDSAVKVGNSERSKKP